MPTARRTHFTIHIPRKLLAKLGYIANYEGRSKNKEIEMMLMEWIRAFEDEQGEIIIKKDPP